VSGPGPREFRPPGWGCAVRLSPGEGSRTRANRARRWRSVSVRGEYVKSHSGRLVSGYRTSGVVGSQWLGLGWRVRVALSFFNWNPAPGSYTRYGDVRVLLESADDRLIVMAPGDEVTLSFDGRALEPPAEGWRRDFILHLAGWAKDHDPNTVAFRTAEPLPPPGHEKLRRGRSRPLPTSGRTSLRVSPELPDSPSAAPHRASRSPAPLPPSGVKGPVTWKRTATRISKDIGRWMDENRELAQRRLETQQ